MVLASDPGQTPNTYALSLKEEIRYIPLGFGGIESNTRIEGKN